jgi:hypothetical protein
MPKEINKAMQDMKEEFNEDIVILKKSNWNSGNENFKESNKKENSVKSLAIDWMSLNTQYWHLKTS